MRRWFAAAVTLLLGSFSLNAMALPPSVEHRLKSHFHPAKADGDCTDFSGAWTGTCTISNGISFPSDITINQYGCDYLDYNGEFMIFGGNESSQLFAPETASSNMGHLSSIEELAWGAKQSTFKMISSGYFHFGGSEALTYSTVSIYAIVKDQLKVATIDKSATDGDFTSGCSYEKQKK